MSPNRQSARLTHLGEFQLIQSIPRQLTTQGCQPTVGTGDDAAVFAPSPKEQVVISTDLLVEEIHFTRKTATLFDIGYKAAAANLSDLAAMGATPTGIFVAIALPPSLTHHDWQEFYRGLATPCRPLKVRLLGGDTSSSPNSLFIAITIIGQVHPKHILTREGAKVGDLIYVSGTLGDSAAGLTYLKKYNHPPQPSTLSKAMSFLVQRHLKPTPKISLGQLLASQPYASSAMDLSDGLSGDLAHLCRQSRVGALILSNHIPMSEQLQRYAKRVRTNPLDWSLHGGEDYELLFTIPPQSQRAFQKMAKKRRIPVTQIGTIQPKRFGIRIEYDEQRHEKLAPKSYEHFSP
ncbi:MAG: thiamine-phosphate kinase [Nitrospirota bacterium]|nr:thiamine-phosphate kinase [Nitrospirota bacterium]MDH5774187.1 thiamine-phosphate kinase [Nitrospirota bacterium]